jgi:integrase
VAWIEKRPSKSGVRHRVGWSEPGTNRQRYKSFHAKEDARAFKREVERAIDHGTYSPEAERRQTFSEYARKVIESDYNLRGSTRYSYLHNLGKWLEGSPLGATRLDRITPTMLRDFLDRVDSGPSARRNVHKLLAKVLNQAKRDRILVSSPMEGVRAPKIERATSVEPLHPSVVGKLASAARTPMCTLAIKLAGYVGLRAGEISGLRLQDVNPLRSEISIVQGTSREGGQRVLGALKTAGSRRTLAIPKSLMSDLVAFVDSEGVTEDGRIFRTPRGGLMDHIRLNEAVHRAAEQAGLPPVKFHDLRHTCASILIQAGQNPKQVQSYLGHQTIAMTLNTYSHLFPADSGALADAMGRLIDEAASVPQISS